MRPLRFLFVATFYPPYSFGGDGISVRRMARALVARGHEVTVVYDQDAYLSLAKSAPNDAEAGGDGVRTVALKSSLGILSSLLAHQTGRAVVHGRKLASLVRDIKPDVIWHNNVSLMGAPGILGLEAPLRVYEAHEHWLVCPTHVLWRYGREPCETKQCLRCTITHRRPPQLWRYSGLLHRKLAGMDLIIAKSEFSRRKHRDYGLPFDMEVLPLFLPPLTAAERPAGNTTPVHPRPYFLFVGRIERIKGVQDLIRATIRHNRADLLIAGNGHYAEELKAQAAGHPRVRFLGHVAPDDLARYYGGAIACVVPSIVYETFGAILIESFRMGTPVIARRLGPFPELIETSGAGLLFETDSELVSAMAALQDDPGRRADLSRAALTAFDAHWREDRVVARYGAALGAAARRKGNVELAERLEDSLRIP
jgi:glycosyltransferase involved in cell wall biosynthesis